MKPYIVCHMVEALDGRIDCDVMEQIDSSDHYYETLDKLQCNATIEGKTTLVMHYAEPGTFVSKHPNEKAGCHIYRATESDSWAIGVDTHGTLLWGDDTQQKFGRPLVMLLSEQAPADYLDYLEEHGISYITCGQTAIDLEAALDTLCTEFGVKRLAVVGGGHLNGSFLNAGLIDEISMLYAAGIDGRQGMVASFDGLAAETKPTRLHLKAVEQLDELIWARYVIAR